MQTIQSQRDPDPLEPSAAPLRLFPAEVEAQAPPLRRRGSPRRIVSWVAAVAAVLVVAVITTALVASHHAPISTAQRTATPAPGAAPVPVSVYGSAGTPGADTNGVIFALDAANGHLRWQYTTPNAMSFKLIADQGVLYFGETDGSVHALDAATGRLLWMVKLPGLVAVEQVADGLVYANSVTANADHTEHFTLYALDAKSGAERWRFTNGGINTLVDGVVYVSAATSTTQATGTIYALNASDGTERWHFQGQGALGVWQVADGQVYIAGERLVGSALLPSDSLYAVDASTGSVRWQYPRQPSGAMQLLGIENGLVYLLSNAGSRAPEGPFTTLAALQASDGSVRWHLPVQGYAVLGSSAIYTGDNTGALVAYRTSDGSVLWRNPQMSDPNPGKLATSGIEINGTAYLLGEKAGVYAVDAGAGKLLWSGGPGQIGSIANGLLITYTFSDLSAGSGAIYGLDTSTGAARWTYTPPFPLARIAIG